jgi:hypothetical protein
MSWRELSDFLHRLRTEISAHPISEFAEVGEKAADTFKRLEAASRESLKPPFANLPEPESGQRCRTNNHWFCIFVLAKALIWQWH